MDSAPLSADRPDQRRKPLLWAGGADAAGNESPVVEPAYDNADQTPLAALTNLVYDPGTRHLTWDWPGDPGDSPTFEVAVFTGWDLPVPRS